MIGPGIIRLGTKGWYGTTGDRFLSIVTKGWFPAVSNAFVISNAYLQQAATVEVILMSSGIVLPGSTMRVRFDTKNLSGDLTAVDSILIVVKDPSDSTRVLYDAGNIEELATGQYMYIFDVPDIVIEGDWHVSVTAVIEEFTAKKNVHFRVSEV